MAPQTQPPPIDSNQYIQRNRDISIRQSSERVSTIRIDVEKRPPPLQTITNSEKRRSLLDRKSMSPIEVPSSSSQKQAESRQPSSRKAKAVMKNKHAVIDCRSNTSSNFVVLPWSPIAVSQRSSKANHRIATQNCQRKSALEVAYPQNTANQVSQNMLSTGVKTDSKRWTKEEDRILAMAVESHNGHVCDWDQLAATFFPGSRTGNMCQVRWKKVGIRRFERLTIRTIVQTLSLSLSCALDCSRYQNSEQMEARRR